MLIFSNKSLFLHIPTTFFFLSFLLSYKKMGVLLEGKALGENIECMDGLEEKVSVFFGEDCNVSNRALEDQDDGYESDRNNSHDPVKRNLFWESQEALVQVHIFNTIFHIEYSSQYTKDIFFYGISFKVNFFIKIFFFMKLSSNLCSMHSLIKINK